MPHAAFSASALAMFARAESACELDFARVHSLFLGHFHRIVIALSCGGQREQHLGQDATREQSARQVRIARCRSSFRPPEVQEHVQAQVGRAEPAKDATYGGASAVALLLRVELAHSRARPSGTAPGDGGEPRRAHSAAQASDRRAPSDLMARECAPKETGAEPQHSAQGAHLSPGLRCNTSVRAFLDTPLFFARSSLRHGRVPLAAGRNGGHKEAQKF